MTLPSTAPASSSAALPPDHQRTMERVHYQVSGCAAHSRLVPLLPSDWIDQSNAPPSTNAPPDFLWENAPRNETRPYRDVVKCYSHLPNGTAVLDDKWALARLFSSSCNNDEKASPHLATLESHCFRGITGFDAFCNRVGMDESQNKESSCPEDSAVHHQFPDLLQDKETDTPPPPPPSNWWVVKDANSNGAGGIWIVGPQNAETFSNVATTPLLQEHRYVAQRYAWPPVLFGGKKAHVRLYALMTADGRAFVHKRVFLHAANEPFASSFQSKDFCESVHITNCCANSHDENKFAGEICADLEATHFSTHYGVRVVPLADFYPSIAASVSELSRRAFPFLRGGEANNGFEYLGIDFILSYDNDDNKPIAYMLEVNAPPSQDTATGLDHAESLHDDVIRDIFTLWVFPKVMGTVEKPGGWKCVFDGGNDTIQTNDDDDESLIVPSKATILNKIRWAIYERKNSRLYDESIVVTDGDKESGEESARNGKETSRLDDAHTELSAEAVATFARSQFPYFAENCNLNNSNDSLPTPLPPQVFFENAGGAQVPRQVITAVSASLAHRNRSVVGSRAKEAARRTLSTILGAKDDGHMTFLGANASCLFQKLASLYVEKGLLSSGDEIIVSTENHLANVTPWLKAAQSVGATIKWWHIQGPNDTSQQDDDEYRSCDLRDLVSSKTRILAISHASNVLGQVRELESICKLAKTISGGYAHVVADGVAAVPHLAPSISTSGVDWYGVSCHKLFGPHIGALCGRRDVAELMDSSAIRPCEDALYKMFETGTTSYEACAGIEGLGRYLVALATFSSRQTQARNQCTQSRQDRYENRLPQRPSTNDDKSPSTPTEDAELTDRRVIEAYKRIRLAESPLIGLLYKRLGACHNIQMIESMTPCVAKLPVFSFFHRIIPSSKIVEECANAGIACRQSTFLSTDALQEGFEFGARARPEDVEGVVRVSVAHYNTIAEVDRLMGTLESLPKWHGA